MCLLLFLIVLPAATADRSALTSASKGSTSAVLATEGEQEAQQVALVHSRGALALTAASDQAQGVASGMFFLPFLGLGRDMLKIAGACIICMILLKCMGKLDCGGKKCNCRRCKCCARRLIDIGWDEFEAFDVVVHVHSVGDIQKDGLFGGKEFKVRIEFGWSKWDTTFTKDCVWNQTKGMEVPQGATECTISLYSGGKWESRIARIVLETKKDMVDKGDDFWGNKQKLKLEQKGQRVGTLSVTFHKKGSGAAGGAEGDTAGAGGGAIGAVLPISGVEDDSALALEVSKEAQEMESTPGFVKPEGKWQDDLKVSLLARVLSGELREVNQKNGKELGKLYIRVLQCNVAELQGDSMKEMMQKQMEKAKKKGLQQPEKKWYWAWYEDRKTAHDKTKWHYPDGYIPMISILRVNRSPERNDQFLITYGEDGAKNTLIYRRESGKGLEVWVEGLDLCYNECRRMVKEKKGKEDKEESALQRMRQMHVQWVQRNGMPRTDEQWTKWFEWLKGSNYDEELIRKLFQEIAAQHQQKQVAAAKGQKR